MNTRHVQAFLMASAAFFTMSAPLRPNSGHTLAAAVAHTVQIAEAATGTAQAQLTLDSTRS